VVTIRLKEHKVCPWNKGERTYTRGFFFQHDRLREGADTLVFTGTRSLEEFGRTIGSVNGNFSVIHSEEGRTYVAVDRITSYPLFYTVRGTDVVVSDDVELIVDQIGSVSMVRESQLEFLASHLVIGKKTLYEGIFEVRAGQCLAIDGKTGEIDHVDHFLYRHAESNDSDIATLCSELDAILSRVFDRLVRSVKGKPIVVFLSGGYDSRLVATSLRKAKYENVICVSFGKKGSREIAAAKEVAASLGYRWMALDYEKSFIFGRLDSQKTQDYLRHTCNGRGLPHLQGILLEDYIANGSIPPDCVVITGHSGDYIEGGKGQRQFWPGKSYTGEQIIDNLVDTIREELGQLDKDQYDCSSCQDLVDFFDWRNRRAKYEVNDIRSYDAYLDVEWRLPLWDNEFVDFWLKVPNELRACRKLYYQYVQKEEYPTANVVTLYDKTLRLLKARLDPTVRLAYPFRKAIGYLLKDSQFYGVSTGDFLRILAYTKGHRMAVLSTQIYMVCTRIYGKHFASVFELLRELDDEDGAVERS